MELGITNVYGALFLYPTGGTMVLPVLDNQCNLIFDGATSRASDGEPLKSVWSVWL